VLHSMFSENQDNLLEKFCFMSSNFLSTLASILSVVDSK
jgi:hypothetical protein